MSIHLSQLFISFLSGLAGALCAVFILWRIKK
jgi:hypothetical protein